MGVLQDSENHNAVYKSRENSRSSIIHSSILRKDHLWASYCQRMIGYLFLKHPQMSQKLWKTPKESCCNVPQKPRVICILENKYLSLYLGINLIVPHKNTGQAQEKRRRCGGTVLKAKIAHLGKQSNTQKTIPCFTACIKPSTTQVLVNLP